MVANSSTRGRTRLVTALIVAAFVLPMVPSTAAQEVPNLGVDIRLEQGSAKFFQSNWRGGGTPTVFLDNNTAEARLVVPVRNHGPNPAQGVPVYMWFPGVNLPDAARCILLETVPAAENTDEGQTVPGETRAEFRFAINDLPPGAYNLSVVAYDDTPNDYPGSDCPNNTYSAVDDAEDKANNVLNAYFVKGRFLDLRINDLRWCKGAAPANQGACTEEDFATHDPQPGVPETKTHFQVQVENVGTWHDMTDYGGACGGGDFPAADGCKSAFQYPIEFRLKAPNGTAEIISPPHGSGAGWAPDGTVHWVNSTGDGWNLTRKAGVYNLTVTIDPEGSMRQESIANDVAQGDFTVDWRDFTANITASDFRTDPNDPYPYSGRFHIRGNVTIRNEGPAWLTLSGDQDRYGRAFNYTVYLDNRSSNWVLPQQNTTGAIGNFSSWTFEIDFVASTIDGSNKIQPGRHTLYVDVDDTQTFQESNESNNNISIDIYIQDTSAPSVQDVRIALGTPQAPETDTVRPNEPFVVRADVADDDLEDLEVFANFTLESNASVTRSYPLDLVGFDNRFSGRISNFTFNASEANVTNGTQENWTVQIYAIDPFGNNVTHDAGEIRLRPWGIHNASVDWLVMSPDEGQNISWVNNEPIRLALRVHGNATGVDNQPNVTYNLGYNVTTPTGITHAYNGSYWSNQTRCVEGAPKPLQGSEIECGNEDSYSTFATTLDKTIEGSAPGTWNISFLISDVANYTRVINRTVNLVDSPPEIHDWNYTVNENLTTNVTNAGDTVTFEGRFTDDDQVGSAHVNFTRISDGFTANFTMPNVTTDTPDDGETYFVYNVTLPVGRGEALGQAGIYNVTIEAVDRADNWAREFMGEFRINDPDTPVITEAGPIPRIQELGENITFYAWVDDETNVTAELQVLRARERIGDVRLMEEQPDGNLTYTLNLSEQGEYSWIIEARDSTGRSAVMEGSFAVRDNLGPRFELRSPSTTIEGARYGPATPRIDVLVYDSDGVDPTTIEMKVADLPVAPEIVPAAGSVNGHILTYTVPPASKFSHKDVVTVSLSAIDNSSKRLQGEANFTFTVDDLAPTARVVNIDPAYRDDAHHPINVSLETLFELAAEDNDGLPTEATALRFRIIGGGNNAVETVYTGPFKITDVPGVYTGPRIYQVQFWAEDDVGNFNRTYNLTTIYVDDTPPALYQFFPAGPYVNATFVDDRVGLDRASVWYRTTPTGIYQQAQLEQDGELWSTVLPAGRKGDEVSYYLQAWDKLGNSDTFGNATAPYHTYDVSNHGPDLQLTAPANGSRISRSVEITWEASDQDGDDLVYTVYYRPPGNPSFVELARIENTAARSYTLDTSSFVDGEYVVRLTASDGSYVRIAETTLTIINRAGAVGTVSTSDEQVKPGDTVLITAEITKSLATVEARVYIGDEMTGAYAMNDAGKDGDAVANDGIFSVRVPVNAAGDYRVDIFTQYQEDGQLKEDTRREAVVFTSDLTPAYVLSEYGVMLAIIGILAVAGIGTAVFVLVRRR